jgi:hypothetical protein
MIGQEFINTLRRDIDAKYQEIADPVVEGACGDYAEYQRIVGFLAGLKEAREIIDALVKRANAGEFS